MVGANACCLAISALPSTASATRREIHPDWLQSSQALFHLGKLTISNSSQYSSHLARSVEPNTEFISLCWTMDISPDMVIFPVGFHADFLGNGITRDWRFLCLICAAPSIHPGIWADSKCWIWRLNTSGARPTGFALGQPNGSFQ